MACDDGSQHLVNTLTVNRLTVNMVNTVHWSVLPILGRVSWHDGVMTADEFLSILDSLPAESEQTYCDL